MAFFGLIGNDRQMAGTTYDKRESASEKASRKRRENHRRTLTATAREGQAWEDSERQRQDHGGRRSWRR
ncbi:hypothetical protein [Streptomyces sp. NPDC097619]|uniref:hypothetical protein n=1 Tax=Streptomyces sp. NPDC097619 TaxID=3157228 RepID=UPI00331D392B